MADDPDPPRKFYQLKPKAFEVVNERVPPQEAGAIPPGPDPGPQAADPGRIEVRELFQQAQTPGAVLTPGGARRRSTEVHAVLRENYVRARAAGDFELHNLDDSKRRSELRRFWLAIVAINVPLGLFAWKIGPGAALPFVFAISAMAMTTSVLIWKTFFLRTHY